MCKQRAVSVCPTSELRAAELRTCAQLFSPCCQWASPGWACPKGLHWEACTQSDIWTTQEGGIIPILWFFCNLTASLSISLNLSLSLFATPTLSPLFSLSFYGRVHRSQSLGKADEQLYNWGSWLFSSRTVPLFPSSSPLPQVLPCFSFLLASP